MSKPLRVAGEVDSWCTRCRLVLNHRIVSMKAGKPYQVECLTCRAQHLWRSGAPGAKAAASSGERPQTGAGSPPGAPRATRASTAAASRLEQDWQKAIAGHTPHEFKEYSVTATFRAGDLVRHKKFGDGVVMRVIDSHKVEVLFRDDARTLAQAMS